MLDEREGAGRARASCDRAFNRKPLWQRAAIVAAGPLANLLLAVLLYAAAHWIGVDEPKAVLGAAGGRQPRRARRPARRRLGARLVAATATSGSDVRSLTDLRWQVTQAVLHGERLRPARQRPRRPRPARASTLDLDALGGAARSTPS